MIINWPHLLAPRHYQLDFLHAVMEGKNCVSVIHRRAGKDAICMQAWLYRGLKRVGTHVYLFPLLTQARQVIWRGMDFDGRPFLSAIPESLIAKRNEATMEITLINGSRLLLGGSNNFNALMGTNPVTIIYSEYSLHNPLARQYLNPILVQNKGIEIAQYTPRGRNHGFDLLDSVRENPKYFVQHLSVDQTFKNNGENVITEEQIDDARKRGMSDEMIRQEFYVDFDVGNIGAYFTREIGDMDREGRITILQPDPRVPLHTVWDLGGTDATVGFLFQVYDGFINILYSISSSGVGLKWYLEEAEKVRQSFGCEWGYHFMPHDVKQEHQGFEHTESRLMQARKHGWHFQVVPKVNFEDGVEAIRYIFPKIRIHKINCKVTLRAITEYQREYDEARACYKTKPREDWTVHHADTLRYLSLTYRRLYDTPQSQVKYEVEGM